MRLCDNLVRACGSACVVVLHPFRALHCITLVTVRCCSLAAERTLFIPFRSRRCVAAMRRVWLAWARLPLGAYGGIRKACSSWLACAALYSGADVLFWPTFGCPPRPNPFLFFPVALSTPPWRFPIPPEGRSSRPASPSHPRANRVPAAPGFHVFLCSRVGQLGFRPFCRARSLDCSRSIFKRKLCRNGFASRPGGRKDRRNQNRRM